MDCTVVFQNHPRIKKILSVFFQQNKLSYIKIAAPEDQSEAAMQKKHPQR